MELEPITRQEKIIAGQDLTPITRLEKFLKNFGGSGGGGGAQADLSQTDTTKPDYVKGVIRQESLPEGYPYKESSKTVIEWDGNTDGLTEVVQSADGQTVYQAMYKVSDLTPSVSELSENGVFNAPTMGIEGLNISAEHFIIATDEVCLGFEGLLVVAYKAGANAAGDTFPEPGVYFAKSTPGDMEPAYVSRLIYGTETIHQMAPEFLPALTSPNGTKYQLTVSDDGTLSAVAQS